MATTSILPLTLGQAVLGRATEPDAPPPEYLRIDGECWKLITDPAAIEAAQAALEARERADSAFAMAQYAPRIANRPPLLADAEGKAPGAGWLEYDPATQLLSQMWRWTGAAWEELPMDPVMIPVIQIGTGTAGDLTADRLIVTSEFVARVAQILELSVENLVVTEGATINELVALSIAGATAEFQQAYIQNLRSNGAVIDEAVIGELASNLITSGLFRTADAGQRLEIDSNGLVMYGVDPDGVDYEMVRLGPSGENLLTIGSTVVSSDSVSSTYGSFEQLDIGGEDFLARLDALPRGIVAWGNLLQPSAYDNSRALQRRAELQTELAGGRLYRVVLAGRYLQQSGSAPTNVEEYIHTSWGAAINPQSPGSGVTQRATTRHLLNHGDAYYQPAIEFLVPVGSGSGGEFRVMYSLMNTHASNPVRVSAGGSYPIAMWVEDVGPEMYGTLKRWNDGGVVDPEPVVKRYTNVVWNAAGYGGDTSAGDVVQGYYSGVGMRAGGWTFPAALRTALSGSTIEKFEVWLENTHWYWGSGGTASIRPNNGSYTGWIGSAFTKAGWPRYKAQWVTVPSSWYASIANGTYRGLGVQTSSTNSLYYGRFKGSATRFRATYRKA